MAVTTSDLQALLDEGAARHKVPGAVLGVLRDGEVDVVATGVLSARTGVQATPDSVFQIGSVTKVWTATMVLQLLDEGRLDLDDAVRRHLPGFRVVDEDVSEAVTLRHLLTHTSGIDGDFFHDTGRGDECLERYVEACAGLSQTHPLGDTLSYCNAGWSILGRVIEVLDGSVWDASLRTRILEPLGLERTMTLPEEALLHSAAVGHVPGDDGPRIAPVWTLMRSVGPAGLITASAADVLGFAAMHLAGGVGPDGTQVLSTASVKAMQQPQAEVPNPWVLDAQHWGLGWFLADWDGVSVIGHDGSTVGQGSCLRLFPDHGVAITLSMNGGSARLLYRDLFTELGRSLAGATPFPAPAPLGDGGSVDLVRYAGRYERLATSIEVAVGADGASLDVTATLSGPVAELLPDPVSRSRFTPTVEDGVFEVREADAEADAPPTIAAFYRPDADGAPAYLHLGARTQPRVA